MPPDSTAEECERCHKKALYGIEDRCRACNHPRPPNVRFARDFVQAVEDRFQEACKNHGTRPGLKEFQRFAQKTKAVVNVKVEWACSFFNGAKILYAPYGKQVEGEVRAPADPDEDRQRLGIEVLMYGSYSHYITYAALSGDGRGLTSYGPVHMELDEATFDFRATVLEENSYSFVTRHGLGPGTPTPFPPGRLAVWRDRHKLAVAKLASDVRERMADSDCCQLLLRSTDDRKTDDFLEVHIYGTFNFQAVKRVRLSQPESAGELTDLKKLILPLRFRELQETLEGWGIEWSEA